MTREEQINEAAAEYCVMYGIGDLFDTMAGFKEGAEWADSNPHWIPVEERLPKENEQVIAYNGVYNEIHLCDYHDGVFEDYFGPFDGTITHWMEIQPPKED